MSFPFSPYNGQLYTTALGTSYVYDTTRAAWLINSQTIIGLTGVQGITGPQGTQGNTGVQGGTGLQGLQGNLYAFRNGQWPTSSYLGTLDTYMNQATPTTNYEANGYWTLTSNSAGSNSGGLLRFDLSAMPSNLIVTNVVLGLTTTSYAQTIDSFFIIYQSRRTWNSSQATWNVYTTGNNWTTAGAQSTVSDIYPTSLGTIHDGGLINTYYETILNASGVAVVQGWISNPATNNGFVIETYNNATNVNNSFYDSDQGGVYLRPVLYVFTQGIQGVTGVQGATGIQGNTGVQGIQGPTGVQGSTGVQGQTGLQGPTGVQGRTGVQGQTGLQGLTGVQGQTGLQGPTGVQGRTGVQGQTGLQGQTGVQGQTGFQGPTGAQGQTGLIGLTGGTWNQGNTGLQGLTGPGSVVSNNYIPVSNGSTYVNSPAYVQTSTKIIVGTPSTTTGVEIQDTGSEGRVTAITSSINPYDLHIDGQNIKFSTGTTYAEKMRLTTNGRLLIDTTTDDGNTLQFNGSQSMYVNDNFAYPELWMYRSKGTPGSPTNVVAGNNIGAIKFLGYNNGDYRNGAIIYGVVENPPGASFINSGIGFYTSNNDAGSEKMRIDSSGNMGIGYTSSIGSALCINGNVAIGDTVAGYPLDVRGAINASNPSNTANVTLQIGAEGATLGEENSGGLILNSADSVSLNGNTCSLSVGYNDITIDAGGTIYLESGSVSWAWPTADGANGWYLATDGNGNLHWSNAGTSAGTIISLNGSSYGAQTITGTSLLAVYQSGGSNQTHTVGWAGLTTGDLLVATGTQTVACQSFQTVLTAATSVSVNGNLTVSGLTPDGIVTSTSGLLGTSTFQAALTAAGSVSVNGTLSFASGGTATPSGTLTSGYVPYYNGTYFTNSVLWMNTGTPTFNVSPTISTFTTAGIVTNNSSGALGSSPNLSLTGKLNILEDPSIQTPSSNFTYAYAGYSSVDVISSSASTITMSFSGFSLGDILFIKNYATSSGSVEVSLSIGGGHDVTLDPGAGCIIMASTNTNHFYCMGQSNN